VIKIKDRRAIELDELKIRYDSLILHNKILLSGYLQHFHPLTRLIDSERLRRRLRISLSTGSRFCAYKKLVPARQPVVASCVNVCTFYR